MVPAIFAPWSVVHLASVPLHEGDRVLDVACGTGILVRRAAAIVGPRARLVALDINFEMIQAGRAAADGMPIEWWHGDALSLPFAPASFDVVLSQQGLQFLPDPLRALREMHRVLAVGGQVAVSVWGRIEDSPGHLALSSAVAHHVGPEPAAFAGFSLSDPGRLYGLISDAGFRKVKIASREIIAHFASVQEFVGIVAAGAASLRGVLDRVPNGARMAFVQQVEADLQPWTSIDGLAFPMRGHIAVASV